MSFKKNLANILLISLFGCSTTEEIFDEITAPDYVNSSKAKRLEIPPDLSELETNKGYNVPGEARSYKDYLENEGNLASGDIEKNKIKVVDNPDGMRIIKSGNLRWLVVNKNPEIIWPHVKNFWEDLGFRVLVANKRTGIIETEWMNTEDIKLENKNESMISSFDKWLDSLSGFADKRKFRTRVEIAEDGSTEIYISQRSAAAAADQHSRILKERSSDYNPSTIYKIEEYKSEEGSSQKKVEISEQREIDDYEIDSELLTRLMVKLGSSDLDAREKVQNPEIIIKAELVNNEDDLYIKMSDPYERAWRRLGLALDLIGFVTEDKNRSEGIYFVRFSELELPNDSEKKDEGLIDSLIFWDDEEVEPKEFEKDIPKAKDSDVDEGEPVFTGIEAPEVKPIDEDYIPEEFESDTLNEEEETWVSKLWPSWGDEDEDDFLPDNEKRFRVRIKPSGELISKVYLDYPNGKKNNSKEAQKVLKIINEYLK